MSTVFCDGLKELTILNGVARLEFHRLHAIGPAGPNRDVQPVTELTIALPAQGLAQVLALLDQVRDKFASEGSSKPAEATTQHPSPTLGRSPNFQ